MKTINIIESFNKDEEFMYVKPYLFIKGYATGLGLTATLKALPLARQLHNGQYRRDKKIINGKEYQTPYVLHILKVCSTLISVVGEKLSDTPEHRAELDILLASALLHDVLEDCAEEFPLGGQELISVYGLPKEVFIAVSLVTKESGLTEDQLLDYFNKLKKNKYSILVKLADRSHNVEDLYNMKLEKLHKYIKETRDFVYPLASYGKQHYPEFSNAFTILDSKIVSLTEEAETIVSLFEKELADRDKKINRMWKIIKKMRNIISNLRKALKVGKTI